LGEKEEEKEGKKKERKTTMYAMNNHI